MKSNNIKKEKAKKPNVNFTVKKSDGAGIL